MTSDEFRNDPMFLRNQFDGDGVFEIPRIKKDEINLEKIALIGYDKLNENETEKIVHFFLDDYKFEVMWNDPEPRVERLKKYRAVLSPNFSLYNEMPLSLKVFNTFRSRWCGAYLQSNGLKVIPTIAWGEPNTFWFCFDGIPEGSVVAVSTLGVRTEKTLFLQGYDEMLRKLKPNTVICYGTPFAEMKGKIIEVDYAESNHLSKAYDEWPVGISESYYNPGKGSYIKNIYGFVVADKGMGSAGNNGGGKKSKFLPKTGKPNSKRSLYKNGKLVQERHYDKQGRAEKDIDYSDHGNPKNHPEVPHEHKWDWSNPDKPARR